MKAQIGPNLIIWFGVLSVVILGTVWFITNVRPYTAESQTVEKDLLEIRDTLNIARNSLFYNRSYNPLTEKGTLMIFENEICINTTSLTCRTTNIQLPRNNITLDDIIFINIINNGTHIYIE